MVYNGCMKKLVFLAIAIAALSISCTTSDLYEASYALDTASDVLDIYSDIIDLSLYPPCYHYHRPLPPPPPPRPPVRPPYRPPMWW